MSLTSSVMGLDSRCALDTRSLRPHLSSLIPQPAFSSSNKLFRVIVYQVTHHGVDVRFVAALIAFGRAFDEQAWAVNAEVGLSVLAGFVFCRPAPGEISVGQILADCNQARGRVNVVEDNYPFTRQLEHHLALRVRHIGLAQPLWRKLRRRAAGAAQDIAHIVVDDGRFELLRRWASSIAFITPRRPEFAHSTGRSPRRPGRRQRRARAASGCGCTRPATEPCRHARGSSGG